MTALEQFGQVRRCCNQAGFIYPNVKPTRSDFRTTCQVILMKLSAKETLQCILGTVHIKY